MSARDQQVHRLSEEIDSDIAGIESCLESAYSTNAEAVQSEHELRLEECRLILEASNDFPPARLRDAKLARDTEALRFKAELDKGRARATAIEIECRRAILSARQTKAKLLEGEMRMAR